jgi:hypothetical protein
MTNDINKVLEERSKTHGSFPDQSELSQQFKLIIRQGLRKSSKVLYPYQDEALDMIVHKISRIVQGNPMEKDHWVDIAGYSTLVANELDKLNKLTVGG